MLDTFKQNIAQDLSFLLNTKVLVTVSGGLDSMVLLVLCQRLKLDVSVAHCNFHLRGEESDGDAAFVSDYCVTHQITYYQKGFDITAYAKNVKTSTQIAARELRYAWFQELAAAEGFDYILTAHHLNDDLETFLINLSRGTGLKGLTGIPEINGKIVRPLLKFSRKRIHDYAVEEGLQWREDSSNSTDNYLRNHLRHHAIPNLQDAQPNILRGLLHTQHHLQQSDALLNVYTQELRERFVKNLSDGSFSIDLKLLKEHSEPRAVLYQLLSVYNFTAWSDIYDLINAQPGKHVFSHSHRLIKDRGCLLLSPQSKNNDEVYNWEESSNKIEGDFGTLTIDSTAIFGTISKNEIAVDYSILQFPLTVRRWKVGDFFYPFGMKGKKKLSKYLKDEKVSLIAKENVWLLCSANDIIWVISHRADDRFKVTKTTKNITKITIL